MQGPAYYKHHLAQELTKELDRTGMTRAELRDLLGCSTAKVNRILQGAVGVNEAELEKVLNKFGLGGDRRAELVALGAETRKRRAPTSWGAVVPDGLQKYVIPESSARRMRIYEDKNVPGLAQTEDYARSQIAVSPTYPTWELPLLLRARMARQRLLDQPNPPDLHIVLSEAVLSNRFGDSSVMRAQVEHLAEFAKRPHVTVQVLPLVPGGNPASGVSFTLYTTSDDRVQAYTENLTDGIVVTDTSRLVTYDLVWDRLVTIALNQSDSAVLLDTVATQL